MGARQFPKSMVCASAAIALTLGLLAGCGGDEPAAAPDPAPIATPTPTPKAGPVTIRGSDFTVTMPGKAKKSKEKPKSGVRLTTTVWTYQSPDAAYSISRVAYPSAPSLSGAVSSAVQQTGGKVATARNLRYRGEPAREVAIVGALRSDREATVFARYVLVGRVLYGMIFYSKEKGAKKAKKQFDAFVGSLTFAK